MIDNGKKPKERQTKTNSKKTLTEVEQPQDLAPFDIIRTESVFSKFPVHNLSKKGSVNIHITKKNKNGQVDFLWKVSPNRDYGEPRQLAYKLDTLVINRKIDEAGRPLPKVICLGSLREICKELELSGSGRDTNHLKKAFLQNVGALITAKLTYKTKEGFERWLEFGGTRYSVVFTREKFPDGRKADATYIIFHDPYWEFLNSAPARPLNYNYLKALPPAAQRFYELISFEIFAAIKHNLPHAKILYSSYCDRAPQQRYYDRHHTQTQMGQLHKPHLQSGYIAEVRYKPTVDDEGKPDWFICYVPGQKAKEEYNSFNRKGRTKRAEGQQQELSLPKDSITTQTEELLKHFYRLFQGVENPTPRPKEKDQATSLIAQYGFEKARYVVEFAHREAPKTNYQPKTFGGILHYTSEALKELEKKMRAKELLRKREEQKQQEEEKEQKEKQELYEFFLSLSQTEQERINAEVMENLKTHPLPIIWQRVREQGEQALTSPMVKAAFETELRKILQRLKQEKEGNGLK